MLFFYKKYSLRKEKYLNFVVVIESVEKLYSGSRLQGILTLNLIQSLKYK